MAESVYRDLIWIAPGRAAGAPCFYGTSVPVAPLFDYLGNGYTVEQFARRFIVPVEKVRGVLAAAKDGLWREIEAT